MPETLTLFMHLLFNSTHKNIKVGTPSGVVKLKRGQYISGRIKLSSELKQSERKIRTSLQRLRDLGIISVKATSRYSIYTIENYELYQAHEDEATSQTPQVDDNDPKRKKTTSQKRSQDTENKQQKRGAKNKTTNRRPANDQPTTTKQEHKHLNNTSTVVVNNKEQPVDNYEKIDLPVDNFSKEIQKTIQFLKGQGMTYCSEKNKRLITLISSGKKLVDFKNAIHNVPKGKSINYILAKMENQA